MKTVWRVFAYLKRYPWMAAGTLSCAILTTLMVIVFPSATKWIINDVVRAQRPEKLLPLILLAAVAFLLQHVFNSLRIILNNMFEQKVIFDLRSDLYSHIQLLPLRWFDNRATGDLMTRVIEDVNSVERVLIDGIEQGVVAVLQIVIVLAVMFYWNAKLAILALVPFPLLIGGALAYTLTAHRRYRLQRRASSAINALLHDNLAGIRQIKSFAREREEHARFNRASDQLRHATLVVMRVWAIYSPSMSMFEAIGALLILGFGGYAALTGAMQIGDLVAFLMLTAFLYDPVSRLHQLNQLVQAGRAAGERVFEILDEPAEPGIGAKTESVGDLTGPVSNAMTRGKLSASPTGLAADRWRHSLRQRQLQLHRRIACAKAGFVSCATRRDDCPGGRDWRRKIDTGESARAFLRIHQRPDLRRWQTDSRLRVARAARSDRRSHTGKFPVQRIDPRKSLDGQT